MTFKLKQNLLALLTASCVAAFAACASSSGTPTEQANAKPSATVETKTTETANKNNTVETTTGKKTTFEGREGEPTTTIHDNSTNVTASSSDKVGVSECDDYIEKYEACITKNVPEAARQTLKIRSTRRAKRGKDSPLIQTPERALLRSANNRKKRRGKV
jgi:hypothetical protein